MAKVPQARERIAQSLARFIERFRVRDDKDPLVRYFVFHVLARDQPALRDEARVEKFRGLRRTYNAPATWNAIGTRLWDYCEQIEARLRLHILLEFEACFPGILQ